MVLGVSAIRRTRQSANGQIEARRTKLPLVIPVRRESLELIWHTRMLQRMQHRAVDLGIAPSALFVAHTSRITQQHGDQSMSDPRQAMLVATEPHERPNRSGREHESVRVTPFRR